MSIIHRTLALYDRGTAMLLKLDFLPLLVARLSVGWVMAEAGWGKLSDITQTIENFRGLGIPMPEIQAPMAGVSELVFGSMLLAGLLTRIASIPLMVIMTVAIITAKRGEIEVLSDLLFFGEFLFIALLLVLLVRGGGFLSLDRLLVWKRSRCGHQAEPATQPTPTI